MASGKSAYLEQVLLDLVFGGTAWDPPDSIWFALSLAAYDAGADGTTLNEPDTDFGYARVALANNDTNFPAASGANPASKYTGADIVFPTATADWGLVLSIYACDGATVGNVLYGADLPVNVPILSGSGFTVPNGSGVFTEE